MSVKRALLDILAHVGNWLELYFWIPLSLIAIYATTFLHYALTGRASIDDPWQWVVGYAPRAFGAILAVAIVSISKEAFGSWLTKQEKLTHELFASVSTICSTVMFVFLLYYFSH